MDTLIPRLQVFEIDDQPWFPAFLRARVQTVLTGLWTSWVPPLQRTSPAAQTSDILLRVFGTERIREFTVVDFCSGAGGPTPHLERGVNARIERLVEDTKGGKLNNGKEARSRRQQRPEHYPDAVPFILTDLSPHLHSWSALSSSSPSLYYIPTPVDATQSPSPSALIASAVPPLPTESPSSSRPNTGLAPAAPKILRTFHLSFHHFPDPLAVRILQNTFESADAIVIVELIERTLSSLVMEALMLVPVAILTGWWSWNGTRGRGRGKGVRDWGTVWGVDWVLLVFTYLLPIVPVVVVFDGWMSSLRARTEGEMKALVERAKKGGLGDDWGWDFGRECHTWPIGYTTYFVGRKKIG